MLHPRPEDQSPVGEPERRVDERSEAPRIGGSSTGERDTAAVGPDPEVSARHVRRRFTTAYKLEILRKADACRPGELGALLRREGLYSSHLITWRRQREQGLRPKKRGRKATTSDPRVKTLEREKTALTTENRRLARRLERAETIIAFQKNRRARRMRRSLLDQKLPSGYRRSAREEWPSAFW
jgi:transposase-like protein